MLPRLAIVHPVPSVINGVLVAALATVARAEAVEAGLLAAAMLGFQVSIGTLNDIVDAGSDRLGKPGKPIPSGLVSNRVAMAIVIAGGSIGLAISASFGPGVLFLGAVGYASGVAYDVPLRRFGLGWLSFAIAFPTLLAWTWVAAAGALPPGWAFLLPLAAIAGPSVHLANSLVDVPADRRAGVSSLATTLGVRRGRQVLAGSVAVIYALAWATLVMLKTLPSAAIVVALAATLTAALGVALSWQESARQREAGWLLQASALAALAVAWLASVSAA